MLAKERQTMIINQLKENKFIKITDIVKRFQVSHETARRDLEALQEQGLAKRVYGGAVQTDQNQTARQRMADRRAGSPVGAGYRERAAIGVLAAELVEEGETVLLAIGSTVLEVARHLKEKRNVTALTNSIPVLNELVDSEVTVYVLGGKVYSDEQTMGGKLAFQALQNFFVDKVFIGAAGITADGGISDYSEEESRLISAMMGRARQVILVAHSDKFGTNSFSVTGALDEVDIIVSDTNLPRQFQNEISERGIRLLLAKPSAPGEEEGASES